jgi:membrane-bound lytic murein transglycosylase A
MLTLRRILLLLLPLWLAACSTVPPAPSTTPATPWSQGGSSAHPAGSVSYSQTPVTALPEWPRQQLGSALSAMKQSCRMLARQPNWSTPCQEVSRLAVDDNQAIRQFFEQRFTAWKVQDGARDSGLITGYYEPALKGSRVRSERNAYPLYGVPSDLVSLSVPSSMRTAQQLVARRVAANRLSVVPGVVSAGADQIMVSLADFPPESRSLLKGRVVNGQLRPYYTRAEIAQGRGVDQAQVLAWVSDPVELFFLQIQGAGRIQLDDGSQLRVGVGDTNGYGYQSIGRWLATQGEMSLSAASMQGIQNWVRAHPERQQALFNVNPRYIFFRSLPAGNDGPIGALGVALTDGYSIAVDPHYIALGTPVYLATSWPMTQQPLYRLVNAQDTGNAIRGALRADFFWGYGAEAGQNAGRMKQNGSLWLLLPNGVQPSI